MIVVNVFVSNGLVVFSFNVLDPLSHIIAVNVYEPNRDCISWAELISMPLEKLRELAGFGRMSFWHQDPSRRIALIKFLTAPVIFPWLSIISPVLFWLHMHQSDVTLKDAVITEMYETSVGGQMPYKSILMEPFFYVTTLRFGNF